MEVNPMYLRSLESRSMHSHGKELFVHGFFDPVEATGSLGNRVTNSASHGSVCQVEVGRAA